MQGRRTDLAVRRVQATARGCDCYMTEGEQLFFTDLEDYEVEVYGPNGLLVEEVLDKPLDD